MTTRRKFLNGISLIFGSVLSFRLNIFSKENENILLPLIMDIHIKTSSSIPISSMWEDSNVFFHRDRIQALRAKYIKQNVLRVKNIEFRQKNHMIVRHYFSDRLVMEAYIADCAKAQITKIKLSGHAHITVVEDIYYQSKIT
jgi:hypothetical protein